MKKTLSEIAAVVGGTVEGDGGILIERLAGIREAGPGALSFIANEKYLHFLATTRASALVVSRELPVEGFALIRVDDPDQAWSDLLELVKPPPVIPPKGIDPSAFVGEDVTLDAARVSLMAHAVVMDGASVGPGTVIYPHAYVGHGARIGEDCRLYPGVVIRERVTIGDRVVVQPGAVIGSDGFGYHETEGRLLKQEQFGTVVLEDDVEIGANVTIDRARFFETRIGKGTKIDNLVQIAHNVVVGESTIIVSQAGISGSTRVGSGVKIAGQVGIVGHLAIGDGAMVAAKSGVSKNIPPGKIFFGIPAGEKQETQRQIVALRRLPGLLKTIRRLEERIVRLEAQSKDD